MILKHLRQLASESLVYGLAGTMTRFITLFLVPMYTRVLTPEDYGAMSLVRNTVTLLQMVASLSLDTAMQRFYWDSEDPMDRKSAVCCWAWCWFVLCTLGGIVLIIFADDLAVAMVGRKDIASSFRIAALTPPLAIFGVVYMNRSRMDRRPWDVTLYSIVTSLMTIVLAAVFVLVFRHGVEGVFSAQFVVALSTALFLIPYLRDWINPRHFQWKRLKAMLRFALPMVPAVVAYWVIDVIDRYFLQLYTTTAQVGLYEIGYSVASVVALGTMAFQLAWTPFALSIQSTSYAPDVYANALLAYTWIGSVACAGVTLFAPEAIRLLTTKAYYGAETVVCYLSFSYFLMGLSYIATLGPLVKKQTSSVGAAVITGALLNIGLNFWLVPKWGMNGAALATLLSYVMIPLYLFYRSQQIYPIPYRFGACAAIILFSLLIIQIGSSWTFQSLWSGVLIKLGLISLSAPLLLVLRIVTPMDIRNLLDLTAMRRVPGAKTSTAE